jgi:phosphoglycolate phosphatase
MPTSSPSPGLPGAIAVAAAPRLATPRAVLFDLDGTLIDTMPAFADVAAAVMHRHHGLDPVRGRAAYLTTSGIPFFKQLEVIAPGDPRNPAAAAEFEREKVEATREVMPSEETLSGLTALRQRGCRLAVCSNNFQDQVDIFVSQCRVPLDLALGFGDGMAKGEPQFQRTCQTFGIDRADVIFVGDSLADAKLAIAAGIRFVARLGTFDAAAFRAVAPHAPAVEAISDLLELFV